jgi:hypothetical protein
LCVLAGLAAQVGPVVAQSAPAPATVHLIIDYGDGVTKSFASIPWTSGMTVQDAMNLAMHMHNGFAYTASGSGETAFLTSIDDARNEGGGAGKKDWQFWVNDQLAPVGFGSQKLNPLDVVRWKFDVSHGS